MKKLNRVKIALIILSLISSIVSIAQPNCQWSKGYGGANEDYGAGVTVDVFGNVYSIGYFNSPTVTFGSTTLINADAFGTTSDVFIVKSDSCGNVLWAKKAGDQDYDDRGRAITTDQNGNVYVTGSYYSYYIKFGSDSLANTGTSWSTYIAKYSPAGTALWAKGFDANAGIFSTDIEVDKNGNIYLSGRHDSDSVKFGNIKLYGDPAKYNLYLAKFDNSGNALWVKGTQSVSGSCGLTGLAIDNLDNIVVSGYYIDSVTLGSVSLLGQADMNALYAKYNPSGNVLWAKGAGNNYNDEATGIAADNVGNIFISGYFQSDSILFDNVKLKLPSPTTTGNGFLIKCDAAGMAIWGKRTGGLSEDYTEVVVTNATGDVFVAGNFRSSSITLDGRVLNNAGANTTYDFYLAKYNTNGQIKWAKKAGNTGNDFVENIALGSTGIPYVIGEYASATISFAGQTLTNNGTDDIYLTNDINRIGMPVPVLCEVTVDDNSQNNIIYWDKTLYTDVERFVVYRETSTNIYKPIASIHIDSLSLFVDTVRTKYFPNTGDPNIGTYRYKIQIMDTVGNYSLLSPYHNTVYMSYNPSNGQSLWNSYEIEGAANPVNSYILMRNDNGSGAWGVVGSVAGSQNTIADPAYSSYPSGSWRMETSWGISCSPTRATINTTRSNIKSSAATTSIANNSLNEMMIYPNPAKGLLTIQYPIGFKKHQLQLFDALGQLVYNEELSAEGAYNGIFTKQIDLSVFRKGIYIINLQTENGNSFRRLVIQ